MKNIRRKETIKENGELSKLSIWGTFISNLLIFITVLVDNYN